MRGRRACTYRQKSRLVSCVRFRGNPCHDYVRDPSEEEISPYQYTYHPKTLPENCRAPADRARTQKDLICMICLIDVSSKDMALARCPTEEDGSSAVSTGVFGISEILKRLLRSGSLDTRRKQSTSSMPATPMPIKASFHGVLVLAKTVAICPLTASPMYTPTYRMLPPASACVELLNSGREQGRRTSQTRIASALERGR